MTTTGLLAPLLRIPGVQCALLVSADDGLVVAESAMEGLDSGAVAALTASLVGRLRKACIAGGQRPPQLMHLNAERGAVLAAPAPDGLLVVAVTLPDANIGLLRLALLEVATGLA